MKFAMLAAVAGAGLVAAAQPHAAVAQAPAASGKDCFRLSQIQGQKVADDKTLYFRTTGREVFRIDMRGSCLSGARFNDPLVIKRAGGSDLICRPIDLDLGVLNLVGGKTPCFVDKVTKLTPEEAAALTDKQRP